MGAEYLYKNYSDAGFNFSKDIISNYCLSLYTKPFVILSGISGTGKTKIAQLFQPYVEEKAQEYDVAKKKNIGKEYITLILREGTINGDGRGNFKKEDLPLLLSPKEFTDYEMERDKLLEKGTMDNFNQLYGITLVDSDNKEYSIQFYVQRAISPLIRVRFKSKRGAVPEYDLQPYLKRKYKVDDVIQLEKISEKKFRIVKSQDEEIINLELSTRIKTYEDNICLIPVKSDWTDPSGIMGFYNIIEKQYHIGPFLKHLLFAIENPDVPFFVILDEMNLSKIEYYLSDVLSVLETRLPHPETGKIISKEKIMLHSASSSDDYIATDDEYFDSIPAKVTIPLNFYITGTINIDETTYTPSPKVLDRANVIEFNEVDLNQYFNNVKAEDTSKFVLHKVPDFTKPAVSSSKISTALPDKVKSEIININDILKKYNLHFGYRIASEISLYISHVSIYVTNPSEDILSQALDYQITQKILPKINGTQAKIEKAILELFNEFTGAGIDIETVDPYAVATFDASTSRFPLAVRKIKSIHSKLSSYGFASSIE
jgi:hypothetical protein